MPSLSVSTPGALARVVEAVPSEASADDARHPGIERAVGDVEADGTAVPYRAADGTEAPELPGLARAYQHRRSRALRPARKDESRRPSLTVDKRLLILDSWTRSKLPAGDFAPLVGLSPHTLYAWKKAFTAAGPAGLADRPRGSPKGSRLSEPTKRAILLMKAQHPEWGCERLHDMLMRTAGYEASASAIARLLHEEGFESQPQPTHAHPDRVRRFERARPNQLWQSDLFTFVLKRENRRVHLVAFLDDHSRFLVGHGLHASASGALVREVLEAAIANYGAPEEVLTDNGPQYHTWRGTSAFTQLLERRGIRHVVASPRHPQTLGKIERFWGTLWRECLETAVFRGLDEARRRVGLFVDHYNFQRTHSGIEGLVPADRYFGARTEVLTTLKARVAANAADLARHGEGRKSFYLTGRVGDASIALHAEGERVVLTRDDGTREEVDLGAMGRRSVERPALELPEPVSVHAAPPDDRGTEDDSVDAPPGGSPLDGVLVRLRAALDDDPEGGAS